MKQLTLLLIFASSFIPFCNRDFDLPKPQKATGNIKAVITEIAPGEGGSILQNTVLFLYNAPPKGQSYNVVTPNLDLTDGKLKLMSGGEYISPIKKEVGSNINIYNVKPGNYFALIVKPDYKYASGYFEVKKNKTTILHHQFKGIYTSSPIDYISIL